MPTIQQENGIRSVKGLPLRWGTSSSFGYDGSGWVVNTGSGSATNSQSRSELGNLMGMLSNPLVLGAICVGIYLWTKR